MTDMHLDDERLSAVLDGVADPEDVAHASACAECSARLDTWRRVLEQVASTPYPAPTAAGRDEAIAAALGGGAVSSLAATRRRRRLRAGPAGLAAAVLLVAGLAVGLTQIGGGSHPAAQSTASRSGTKSATSSQGAAISSGAAASGLVPATGDLGNFSTPAGVRLALQQRLAEQSTPGAGLGATQPASATRSGQPAGCPAKAATDASLPATATPVDNPTLTYRGNASTVWVFTKGGHHVAVVESNPGCVLETTVTFS